MARRVLLGVLIVVLGTIGVVATPDAKVDLPGVYRCTGTNPDGSAYQGVVEIAQVQGTYRVRWTLGDDLSILGVGIMSNGVFAVSYFGGAPAVVVYKVDGNRLVGEWTMGGAEGAVYAETLTKMGSQAPDLRKPADRKPASNSNRVRVAGTGAAPVHYSRL